MFHRVEAVRVTLAKHEVPRSKQVYAAAAGYARIDMANGSIQWFIDLGRNETEVTSRRDLVKRPRYVRNGQDASVCGVRHRDVAPRNAVEHQAGKART